MFIPTPLKISFIFPTATTSTPFVLRSSKIICEVGLFAKSWRLNVLINLPFSNTKGLDITLATFHSGLDEQISLAFLAYSLSFSTPKVFSSPHICIVESGEV